MQKKQDCVRLNVKDRIAYNEKGEKIPFNKLNLSKYLLFILRQGKTYKDFPQIDDFPFYKILFECKKKFKDEFEKTQRARLFLMTHKLVHAKNKYYNNPNDTNKENNKSLRYRFKKIAKEVQKIIVTKETEWV